MSQFKMLYDKVLSDVNFRSQLVANPSSALQSIGITPTADVLAAVNQAIQATNQLSGHLDMADDEAQECIT